MSQAALAALPAVLAALVAAAVVSFLLTPVAIGLGARMRAIDLPGDDRRVHQEPTPRTGGLAVAASFVLVAVLGLLLNEALHFVPDLKAVRWPQVAGLVTGVGVGAMLGYLDDRLRLRARWQLAGQLVLAGVALASGVVIEAVANPLGGSSIRFVEPAAMAITVVWVVGMINSANFIDGLDGLLAGIAIIAAVTLGIFSLAGFGSQVQPFVAVCCGLLAGALLGFLPWNFHPARVFIGTAGVFAVGYALAVLSVLGTAKVAVALLVLGVPIIDTFWVIVRRVGSGRAPFSADRGHFHHRLLDLGLSHKSAVLVIYGLCIVLAALSLVLTGRGQVSAFIVIVLGAGLVLFVLNRRARAALDRSSYPDGDDPGGQP